MSTSLETIQGLLHKMTFSVPRDRIESRVNSELQKAAKDMQLDGFRRGRVPLKVLDDRFGAGLREKVAGELMGEYYYSALAEHDITPADEPRFERVETKKDQDPEFVARFEVLPQIELPDFSGISVEQCVAEITESDIDEMTEVFRHQRPVLTEVQRASEEGDRVNIDYTVKRDGEFLPDRSAENVELVLGDGHLEELQDSLIGRQVGDVFTLDVDYPADCPEEDLADTRVNYTITLNSVKHSSLPEVNLEFINSFDSKWKGVEEFRAQIALHLDREARQLSRNRMKNQVLEAVDRILDVSKIEIPKRLLRDQMQQVEKKLEGDKKASSRDGIPYGQLRERARDNAVQMLLWLEIIRQGGISLDRKRVRQAVEELASTYESPDEVVDWYYSQGADNEDALRLVEMEVIEDQAFDHILQAMNVTEKRVSFQELMEFCGSDVSATGSDREVADKENTGDSGADPEETASAQRDGQVGIWRTLLRWTGLSRG